MLYVYAYRTHLVTSRHIFAGRRRRLAVFSDQVIWDVALEEHLATFGTLSLALRFSPSY